MRFSGIRTILAAVFAFALIGIAAGPASAAVVTKSADFDIPANASGFAVVKMASNVECELTAEFELNGKVDTFTSNGPVTSFKVRYNYDNGPSASTVHVTVTCEYSDDFYGDPGLEIFDPFNVPDKGEGGGGALPNAGGVQLLLLVGGLVLAVGGGYGAYRLRR